MRAECGVGPFGQYVRIQMPHPGAVIDPCNGCMGYRTVRDVRTHGCMFAEFGILDIDIDVWHARGTVSLAGVSIASSDVTMGKRAGMRSTSIESISGQAIDAPCCT